MTKTLCNGERPLPSSDTGWGFNKIMTPAIIFDIDGTLALRGERSPYDWDNVGNDAINEPIVEILSNLEGGNVIILVSGRDEICREKTEDWLRNKRIRYDYLFMRPEGNREPDDIVKERIYRQHIEPSYKVTCVFDDRDKVVKMWRRIGLTCLQVAEGNF